MEQWLLTVDNDVVSIFDDADEAFDAMYERARRVQRKTNGWLEDKNGLTLFNDNPEITVEGSDHVFYKFEVIRLDNDSIDNHNTTHNRPAMEFMSYCERNGVGDDDEDCYDMGNVFDYMKTKGDL